MNNMKLTAMKYFRKIKREQATVILLEKIQNPAIWWDLSKKNNRRKRLIRKLQNERT
jgi:hypothetical protein